MKTTESALKRSSTSAHGWAQIRRPLWSDVYRYRHYYILMLPAIVLLIVMRYVPMAGIVLAFKRYNIQGGIWHSPWAGFRYFQQMIEAPEFTRIMVNTIRISALRIGIGFPAPILFALMLNEIRKLRLKKFVQTLSYLPHFLSWVVVGGLVLSMFSLDGPVNHGIRAFGGAPVQFMQEGNSFLAILIGSGIWKSVGWGSIIYLAAISGIDPQLYEAAEIDGAGRIARIRHITLPSLFPVIITLFILRIGNMLEAGFDQIFNMYNPLVYSVADIIDTYVYRTGIVGMRFSFATAVGLSKNLIGFALVLFTNYTVKKLGGSTIT